MEININCDLGEKSVHHSNKNDPDLLAIVNSASVACGYHAGDDQTMSEVVQISKKNGVSIGSDYKKIYSEFVPQTTFEVIQLLKRWETSGLLKSLLNFNKPC